MLSDAKVAKNWQSAKQTSNNLQLTVEITNYKNRLLVLKSMTR
jgi:hypothetical protein